MEMLFLLENSMRMLEEMSETEHGIFGIYK